ncbi:MAG TPA: hypothetical protein VGF24_12615 [Vicinamibacterales bacterium]|jgi:hypothetical protein
MIDTLLGDLSEEYEAGRSRTWFWWQVCVAIPVTFAQEVRAHIVLTIRALAIGWLTMLALTFVAMIAMNFIEGLGWPYPMVPVSVYQVEHGAKMLVTFRGFTYWTYLYRPMLDSLIVVSVPFVCAWLVAHLHRRVRTPAVLAFTAMLALFPLNSFYTLAFWLIYPHPHATVPSAVLPPDTPILMLRPWFAAPWFRVAYFIGPLIASLLGGLSWRHRQIRAG